jgi:hypothetical protein
VSRPLPLEDGMDEYEDAIRRRDIRALKESRKQLADEALEHLESPELTMQQARLWEALIREMREIKKDIKEWDKDLEAQRQEHHVD